MQIILLEKIGNVGNLGDVVKVKDGYARNFLIPHGKAKRATPENLKAIEARRADLEKAAGEKLASAQALAEKLEGSMLRIAQKAGVDGRLFGSVTNADIVEALKAQGVEIEKSMVRMPSGPLKLVGEHPVSVVLHTDVTAHISVNVVGETVVG
jgi:large subunit ribosomal protein L9